jgi:hypothetical protein
MGKLEAVTLDFWGTLVDGHHDLREVRIGLLGARLPEVARERIAAAYAEGWKAFSRLLGQGIGLGTATMLSQVLGTLGATLAPPDYAAVLRGWEEAMIDLPPAFLPGAPRRWPPCGGAACGWADLGHGRLAGRVTLAGSGGAGPAERLRLVDLFPTRSASSRHSPSDPADLARAGRCRRSGPSTWATWPETDIARGTRRGQWPPRCCWKAATAATA